MSQLEYDVAEFLVNNGEEIVEDVKQRAIEFNDLFKDFPPSWVTQNVTKCLIENLMFEVLEHFEVDYENMSLIFEQPKIKLLVTQLIKGDLYAANSIYQEGN